METNRPTDADAVQSNDSSSIYTPPPPTKSARSRSADRVTHETRSGTTAVLEPPVADVDRRSTIAPAENPTQEKIDARIAEMIWQPPEQARAHRFIKRTMDIVISSMALVVLSPLFLTIALAVCFTDFGPVFYSQDRVGTRGRYFRFFKFRTMVTNADAKKAALMAQNNFAGDITFKIRKDPRITRIGHFLRKTSLDEFPQLLHVLTGQMTLVGPRPAVPEEVQYYSETELRRVFVKPGLTCYWQVCGRSDLPFEEQVRLDLEYIRDETILVDLGVLARTIPALLFMRGAY